MALWVPSAAAAVTSGFGRTAPGAHGRAGRRCGEEVVTKDVEACPPCEARGRDAGRWGRRSGAGISRRSGVLRARCTVSGVAAWRAGEGTELATGTRITLEGVSIAAQVRDTAGPVRVDSFAGAAGPIAEEARGLGIRSSVGCPVVVRGRLWGVIAASSKAERAFPPETESQIGQFTELLATAIANADSRQELIASRARILLAADEARRRIQRDLHDGAQQRLVHTVISLKLARRAHGEGGSDAGNLLDEALEHAESATSELRELSHGILPSVLANGGLRAGVESLVSRISLPVTAEVCADRFHPGVEATAYFIISEALTNTVKHAAATRAEVRANADGGGLRIEVRDDGAGGAQIGAGSGLQGLKDRVAALDGTLQVESQSGGGTRIVATLPEPRS